MEEPNKEGMDEKAKEFWEDTKNNIIIVSLIVLYIVVISWFSLAILQ